MNWYMKSFYDRGVGVIPVGCSEGLEYQHGLCYTPCKSKYSGLGPLCWRQCDNTNGNDCMYACVSDTIVCTASILSEQQSPLINFFYQVDQAFLRVGGVYIVETYPRQAMEALFYIASAAIQNGATEDDFLRLSEAVASNSIVTLPREAFQQVYQFASNDPAPFGWLDSNINMENVTAAVLAFRKVIC
jgi:hypothetical protein